MLSFDKIHGAIEIARIYEGNPSEHRGNMEGSPVYWHRKKDKRYRIEIEDSDEYLSSKDFRIRYKISELEQEQLKDCILDDKCPENSSLVKKFFKIREDLEERLYGELILGPNEYLRTDFPDDKKVFPHHRLVVGGTGQGKTYACVSEALANLQGKPSARLNILYLSTELEYDKTLKTILQKRYQNLVTGVDTSEEAYQKWSEETEGGGSVQKWFEEEILSKVNSAKEHTHMYFDDSRDSPAHKQLLNLLNKALRTFRHKKISVTSIQHRIRGREWTSQSFSSILGILLFPNSSKGKIVDFLAHDIGLGIRKARQCVKLFSDTGRTLFVRFHTPEALIGTRVIQLT